MYHLQLPECAHSYTITISTSPNDNNPYSLTRTLLDHYVLIIGTRSESIIIDCPENTRIHLFLDETVKFRIGIGSKVNDSKKHVIKNTPLEKIKGNRLLENIQGNIPFLGGPPFKKPKENCPRGDIDPTIEALKLNSKFKNITFYSTSNIKEGNKLPATNNLLLRDLRGQFCHEHVPMFLCWYYKLKKLIVQIRMGCNEIIIRTIHYIERTSRFSSCIILFTGKCFTLISKCFLFITRCLGILKALALRTKSFLKTHFALKRTRLLNDRSIPSVNPQLSNQITYGAWFLMFMRYITSTTRCLLGNLITNSLLIKYPRSRHLLKSNMSSRTRSLIINMITNPLLFHLIINLHVFTKTNWYSLLLSLFFYQLFLSANLTHSLFRLFHSLLIHIIFFSWISKWLIPGFIWMYGIEAETYLGIQPKDTEDQTQSNNIQTNRLLLSAMAEYINQFDCFNSFFKRCLIEKREIEECHGNSKKAASGLDLANRYNHMSTRSRNNCDRNTNNLSIGSDTGRLSGNSAIVDCKISNYDTSSHSNMDENKDINISKEEKTPITICNCLVSPCDSRALYFYGIATFQLFIKNEQVCVKRLIGKICEGCRCREEVLSERPFSQDRRDNNGNILVSTAPRKEGRVNTEFISACHKKGSFNFELSEEGRVKTGEWTSNIKKDTSNTTTHKKYPGSTGPQKISTQSTPVYHIFIFRLSPPDYHHFHSPVHGQILNITHIPGSLLSVHSKCMANGAVMRNRRVIVEILLEIEQDCWESIKHKDYPILNGDSTRSKEHFVSNEGGSQNKEHFVSNEGGSQSKYHFIKNKNESAALFKSSSTTRLYMVIIGATLVGSIILGIRKGDRLEKGQHMGWFEMGGSTVVLVYAVGEMDGIKNMYTSENHDLNMNRLDNSAVNSPVNPIVNSLAKFNINSSSFNPHTHKNTGVNYNNDQPPWIVDPMLVENTDMGVETIVRMGEIVGWRKR